MALWRGCDIPEDRYYDVERDVWLSREPDGHVRLGMTDPAQTRCGKIVHLRIKRDGRHIERGKSVATIESAKWVGPVRSPVSGTIAAGNRAAFEEDVLIANRDPYGEGWIVRMLPDRWEEESRHLVTGDVAVEKYKERIEEMDVSCIRCTD